jgi:hypothetical protein
MRVFRITLTEDAKRVTTRGDAAGCLGREAEFHRFGPRSE